MLTRKQIKLNNQEAFRHLGRQFYERRMQHGITLERLAMRMNVPPYYMDTVESGKGYINFGMLSHLAAFYNCKIKIELEPCPQGDDEKLDEWRKLKPRRENILT